MKRIYTVLLSLLVFLNAHSQDFGSFLDSLYQQNEYFKLRNVLQHNPGKADRLREKYYQALLDNKFNHPQQSAAAINDLFTENNLSDSQKTDLYKAQVFNYLNQYDYKKAGEWVEKAMQHALARGDSSTYDGYKNVKNITDGLADAPPQSIDKHGDITMKYKRDIAGLIRLPVWVNAATESTPYIFDSGANISVITESEAKKINFKYSSGGLKVKGVGGHNIESGIGVADSFKIGSITLRNVALLVLPDETLTARFLFLKYSIKGIIGFPVMQQLKEIQITKKQITVPAVTTPDNSNNMALSGYSPVILMRTEKNDSVNFVFDSGAKITLLFNTFYKKYNYLFDPGLKTKTMTVIGAGGRKKIKVKKLKRLPLTTGESKATLKKVAVYMDDFDINVDYLGIIGQDYIQQFKGLTMNFEYMYIKLEN
ncbi:MAG TPA: pepsin/retropepsin-like aspartic protease family protein [Bacteroidia bacterium]|nr:pepsin/retropepsin-like aspartic protease family protein [Bacteroidia bacterium]